MEVAVLDISASGLQARVPEPLPCGATVKIDGENVLVLGEVLRCEPAEGAYRAGIQFCHEVASLMELKLLHRALLGADRVRNVETPAE